MGIKRFVDGLCLFFWYVDFCVSVFFEEVKVKCRRMKYGGWIIFGFWCFVKCDWFIIGLVIRGGCGLC